MTHITVETKQVATIARAVDYRRRKVWIQPCEHMTMQGVNWSGGSRNTYTAIDLETGRQATPNTGAPAPWNNPFEGLEVAIPKGIVIVRTGFFCGKPSMMTIYVHPENMPKLLP